MKYKTPLICKQGIQSCFKKRYRETWSEKKIHRTSRISKYVVYKETLVNYKEKFWSFLGSFLGLGTIAFIQSFYFHDQDNFFLIGSFGASSVLIYGVIQSPLAQPRNLIGGHLLSAVIGVSVAQLLPDILWLSAPAGATFRLVSFTAFLQDLNYRTTY